MALKRIWTPSGSYSSGGTKRILVIHTMEGFTGANGAYDCAHYFQGNVGASSQVCIDNNRGTIWEGVAREKGAWTQCGYNSVAVSCEQSGYAAWSRQYWLDTRENQLRNIADWLAEESTYFGIPLVDISSSAAQGSGTGVCYHSELGSTGCGHSDPGGGWPIDKVLEWAKGGSAETPQQEDDVMASSTTIDSQGALHFACIGVDNRVYYQGPRFPAPQWKMVDEGSNAKSGCGITVTRTADSLRIFIVYTNQSGAVCMYESKDEGVTWGWSNRGGNAR